MRRIVTRKPKKIAATGILVFDSELFIGGRYRMSLVVPEVGVRYKTTGDKIQTYFSAQNHSFDFFVGCLNDRNGGS